MVNGGLSHEVRAGARRRSGTAGHGGIDIPDDNGRGPAVGPRPRWSTAIAVSAVTLSIATFELRWRTGRPASSCSASLPLAALVFCGCALWSVTLLLRIRNGGAKFALPFLIYALTLAILVYAPLQQIALQQNFHWHRQTANGSWRGSKPANSSPTSTTTRT